MNFFGYPSVAPTIEVSSAKAKPPAKPEAKPKPKAKRKRYNVMTKKNSPQEAKLQQFLTSEADANSVDLEDVDVTTLSLTEEQAKELKQVFDGSDPDQVMDEDVVFTIPPVTYLPADTLDTASSTIFSASVIPNSTPVINAAAAPQIITGIPKYAGKLYGQDVAVMDSVIYPNIANLNGFKVKLVQSMVGDTPCLPHGTNVAEVIAQGIDPAKTDMQILNFGVFDCNGRSSIGSIAGAVQAILNYKKGPGKNRGLTVNFSGEAPSNSVIDGMFKRLISKGINVVVAAGNGSTNCLNASPAVASCQSAVQSIGATDGQTLASFSNYATEKQCVDVYLPGCLPMTNPTTGKPRTGCGTSFSAPIQTLRDAVYKQSHKKQNPSQVKQGIKQNTVTIDGPNGLKMRTITDDMAFAWKAAKQPAKKPVAKAPAKHKIAQAAAVAETANTDSPTNTNKVSPK
jgi:hypothetical protein